MTEAVSDESGGNVVMEAVILELIIILIFYIPETPDAASYNLNIIILLSSYPFISLVNCPWLLFIIILLSYSFMALSGFLFIYIIIAINYWIRDVIREYTKKYEVLIIMLFIVFLVFVFSEALLFLSFFWVSFHTTCSRISNFNIPGHLLTYIIIYRLSSGIYF